MICKIALKKIKPIVTYKLCGFKEYIIKFMSFYINIISILYKTVNRKYTKLLKNLAHKFFKRNNRYT